MSRTIRSTVAALGVCAIFIGSAAFISSAGAQDVPKKTVTSADDLPRFTYPVADSASALLTADAATFAAFGAKVRADIDRTLTTYDIQDRGTLRGLLTEKLDLQLLAGDDAGATKTIADIRPLEDKPDAKILSGIITTALIDARAATGATSGDVFAAAFEKRYAAALAPLPWNVVGATLKESKTTFEVVTPALMTGQVAATLDPAVAKTHELSGDAAGTIIRTRYFISVSCPSKHKPLPRCKA